MDTSPDTTPTQSPVLYRHFPDIGPYTSHTLMFMSNIYLSSISELLHFGLLLLAKKNAVVYVCVCDYEKEEEDKEEEEEEEEPILIE